MKPHERAGLVTRLTDEVRTLCPGAPQQLRAVLSRAVNAHMDQYTAPESTAKAINGREQGHCMAKDERPAAEPLECPMWTERQCCLAREVMNELLAAAQVENEHDYRAFLARVEALHVHTAREWHQAGTGSQMWRNQGANVRLRLAIKYLLTIDAEDIYSIAGRGPLPQ